jgi:hypothetical protein
MKKEIEIYKRKTIFAELKDYDYLSKENAYIEITEWNNGDGYDVNINNFQEQNFNITHGQLKAINKLIKKLEK